MNDPAHFSDRINSFALVGYIPGALGEFITDLRVELIPGCTAQSHVTVLPPRPLHVAPSLIEDDLRARIAEFSPFELELRSLRIFEETSVIFIDIGTGRQDLLEMHDILNAGHLQFDEPYTFHPHITVAQGLDPMTVGAVFETAKRRWIESAPARSCLIEQLTFVQNTERNCWIDLAECELRGSVAVGAR